MGNHGQVGRLGGDEFQAVLPGTVDIGLLESLARTLIEQVSRPYVIEGHKVTIGASVGITIGDPGRGSADALVRNADLALYAAKGAGRGKHCFYQPSMHSEAAERQLLENDLRQAIERGELSVAYQPIVRTAGEEISGFEALVRWNHPTRGAISPDKFVPLAEEAGLIGKIGEWVLQHRARGSRDTGPTRCGLRSTCRRSSSTTPRSSTSSPQLLDETGVRADRLELEITEGVFLADGDTTDETFARLKDARRPPRARRLRHRLQLARLFEEGAVRQDQDRPELRPRRGLDHQPQQRDHPRHRHARRNARHGHLRRGRRNARRSPT